MNSFDLSVLSFVNGFAGRSWLFDQLMISFAVNNLLKGGVFSILLWWAWFSPERDRDRRRGLILGTLLSCLVALFAARALAILLPFRPRPMYLPELALRFPYGPIPRTLESWSAFPSDHATLFFALAAGIYLLSRPLGIAAFAYVCATTVLPRIYWGLHWPTDIVAGTFLGVAVTYGICSSRKIRCLLYEKTMPFCETYPGAFYAGFFLLTYQIANLFTEVRALGSAAFKILRAFAT